MALTGRKAVDSTTGSDFNADELIGKSEKHDQDISGLDLRVTHLERRLKSNEEFANAFEKAARDSKKLDGILSKIFCDFLEKDDRVKAAVTKHLQGIDRSAVYSLLKKWGGLLTNGVVYILGILTTALVQWIISKTQ